MPNKEAAELYAEYLRVENAELKLHQGIKDAVIVALDVGLSPSRIIGALNSTAITVQMGMLEKSPEIPEAPLTDQLRDTLGIPREDTDETY